jgi:hypothetical protein
MQGEVEVEGWRTLEVVVVVACLMVVQEQKSIRWSLRMKNRRQVGVVEEVVVQKVVGVQYALAEEELHWNRCHM